VFVHLDAQVPEELKYSLYVLFISHERSCSKCAAPRMPEMVYKIFASWVTIMDIVWRNRGNNDS
jgi:hypothetical protein